ncbi:MAG: phosphopantetheine-binding protein [Actinomycetota bacterium]|jgi:acyl carrier protein|nr:phosphopantetheine-binding protein [Actinomycetota bacterium]
MTDDRQAIKEFIVEEFLPDVSTEELDADYDLLAGGVVDSLGLLQIIAWLEDRFQVALDDAEIGPESFRSVNAIHATVAQLGTEAHAS